MSPSPLIEDQIAALSSRALHANDPAEAERILTELRKLLREQINRTRDRANEINEILK